MSTGEPESATLGGAEISAATAADDLAVANVRFDDRSQPIAAVWRVARDPPGEWAAADVGTTVSMRGRVFRVLATHDGGAAWRPVDPTTGVLGPPI